MSGFSFVGGGGAFLLFCFGRDYCRMCEMKEGVIDWYQLS